MKKGLLNYATIISITILIILNGTTSIYAYNILENNDKTLDILVINSYDSKNEWENHVLTGLHHKIFHSVPPFQGFQAFAGREALPCCK